ncbi:MAG: hypothetical protein M3O88_09855 [Actinomycetota bacterium]|nr:hypothetical protein [Actinomycetota bacterium]
MSVQPPPDAQDHRGGRAAFSREALPALVVLAVIVAVVSGGYLAGGALAQPVGPPVSVGGAVELQPISGWTVAARLGTDHVRLTRGGGNLDVLVSAATDPASLLHRYLSALGRPPSQLSVSPDPRSVTLESGAGGLRVFYVGLVPSREVASIEGEITAVVTPGGVGVLFDGWAPKGLFSYVENDLEHMIGTARISPRGGGS